MLRIAKAYHSNTPTGREMWLWARKLLKLWGFRAFITSATAETSNYKVGKTLTLPS